MEAAAGGLLLRKGAAGDSPIPGEAHHEDAPFQARGFLERALPEAEATALQIRDPVFTPPAHAVIKAGITVRLDIHRQDPRLLLALCMQRSAVGQDAAAVECGPHDACRDAGRNLAGGQCAAGVGQGQMTLQTKTVRPCRLLAPANQWRRPLQALGCQQDREAFRKPCLDAVQQLFLPTNATSAWC